MWMAEFWRILESSLKAVIVVNAIIEQIKNIGIIPVVTVESADQGVKIMKALEEGGLLAAEVTFRTEAAIQSIYNMKKACPQALIGAGTILGVEQAKQAIKAGASFLVSPGCTQEVMAYCVKNEITMIPGCMTPSDIQMALAYGLEIVKFFPAEAAGGLQMLKAISQPYPNVRFMPTGGISLSNIREYLSFEKVICCGGSWITSGAKMDNYKQISREAREAVNLVAKLRRNEG